MWGSIDGGTLLRLEKSQDSIQNWDMMGFTWGANATCSAYPDQHLQLSDWQLSVHMSWPSLTALLMVLSMASFSKFLGWKIFVSKAMSAHMQINTKMVWDKKSLQVELSAHAWDSHWRSKTNENMEEVMRIMMVSWFLILHKMHNSVFSFFSRTHFQLSAQTNNRSMLWSDGNDKQFASSKWKAINGFQSLLLNHGGNLRVLVC